MRIEAHLSCSSAMLANQIPSHIRPSAPEPQPNSQTMSRPGGSLRERMQGGAGAARSDKFAGALVEKRSDASDIPTHAAADAGPPIRSSGLHAPFGQQSSATSPAARGSRAGFGQQKPNSGVGASGNKALDRVFVAARRSGQLIMDNMGLSAFPPQVCSLYDEGSITAEEKFWECVDLLGISMQHNAISVVPVEITNLMHLQVLVLAHNQIAELPSALTELRTLKKIDCSHNALRSLPDSIGELQNLVELNVSHNNLTALPDSLCDLARLEVLSVDHNALESLPPEMGLLRQLLRINASANRMQGLPASMADCTRLSSIEIKQNRLQSDPSDAPGPSSRAAPRSGPAAPRLGGSTGMPSFRGLKDLVLLDLSENCLTRIPELPRGSSKLAQVFFGFNTLRDCSALVDCPALVTVDLHNNKLESIPRELGRKDSSIKLLDLSNNELSDIAGELGLMTSLNKLLVDGNPLRKFPRAKLQAGGLGIEALKKYLITRIDADALTQAVGESEAAEMLGGPGGARGGPANSANPDVEFAIREGSASSTLNFSRIAPPLQSFPDRLWALPSLGEIVSLDLSNSRIAPESFPAQIALMKRCKIFVGNACGWKEMPLALCSLLALQELSLAGNALTTLPPNLAALRSLRKINLNQNAFTRWPDVLCEPELAAGITHLTLANNKLVSLPSDFCSVFRNALMELDVGGNKLTALPEGWRCMSPGFQSLNVENNQLASLPLELGLCVGLKSLMVGGNPQHTVLYAVLAKGTPAILAALKLKIPAGSELLRDPPQTQQAQAGRSAPQPQGARRQPSSRRDDRDEDEAGVIEVDTDQRGRYAEHIRAGSGGNQRQSASAASAASSSFSARYAAVEDDRDYDGRSSHYHGGSGRDYDRQRSADDRDYAAPRGSASRGDYDYPRDAPQHQHQARRDPRGYDDDSRYDDRDRRDGYASQLPSRSAAPPPASSYAREQPRSYDRDDRSDGRYDDRSQHQGRRAPSYGEENRRAQYDEPPARQQQQQQQQRSYASSSNDSAASSDLSSLQRSISALEDQLENNLSLGNLQKLQKRKELAALKAEFNRKQAR